MKNKLFTLAAALMLAAVLGGIYAGPAMAQVIKAALVKNVDEKGRAPFRQKFTIGVCPTVPAGKRLLVEHASGSIAASDPVLAYALTASGARTYFDLKNHLTTSSGSHAYTIDSTTLIYFNPGDTNCGIFSVGDVTFSSEDLTLSGYFVDSSN